MTEQQPKEQALDVRPLRKPDKHPKIFATYGDLPVGASFVLINDHDPKHLREEFGTEHPGSFGWEYLNREPGDWRVRITKLTTTPLPRTLVNTIDPVPDTGAAEVSGAVWKLEVRERDLDVNIIALTAGGTIDTHVGPEVDVLIHVLAGCGQLVTEQGAVDLQPGVLAWLPRRSRRRFNAGPAGLRYLTVHQRRNALVLDPAVRWAG